MTETEEWISYHLDLPKGGHREYRVSVLTGLAPRAEQKPLPEWTKMSCNRCAHCKLDAASTTHCPLAVSLVDLVEDLREVQSHDGVTLNVITAQRQISANTTMQRALSSLLGLVMATSACPSMRFFRPMARFHLPLSSHDETMFRVMSTYFLAKYFMASGVRSEDKFESLVSIYRDLREINMQIAKRIQTAETDDATTNAVVLLHVFTCVLPLSLEESLQELRLLFAPAVSQMRLVELESEVLEEETEPA